MPAFTFEKIAPGAIAPETIAPEIIAPAEHVEHASDAGTFRRSAIVRFLDRLTAARLRKSEDDFRRMQRLKHKHRGQI